MSLITPDFLIDDENVKEKVESLLATLVHPDFGPSAQLADRFLCAYRELLKDGKSYPLEIAFPALFDFIVTAEYASRMVADAGWIYCRGDNFSANSCLYFPFLKTCPRCSIHLGKKPSARSNKPSSDTIGEISGDVTLLILSKILEYTNSATQICKSTNRQGDVDLVISNPETFVLAEVKSSPLVVYPLEISLSQPMTEVKNGATQQLRDHSSVTAQTAKGGMSLYVAHKDLRISLGPTDVDNWPYPALIEYVGEKDNAAFVVDAWKEVRDVYRSRGRSVEGNQIDNRKWITCGCGGRVDDSKNAPGIDRTDDIKKGTYQVLKLGAFYKEKISHRKIFAILVSNFFPHRTNDRYLEDLKDILWTKPKYEIELKGSAHEEEMRLFKESGVFNLFDAVLCFTGAFFQNHELEKLFGSEKFLEAFLNE